MSHPVEDPTYPEVVTVGVVNFASVLRDKAATLAKMVTIAVMPLGRAATSSCSRSWR